MPADIAADQSKTINSTIGRGFQKQQKYDKAKKYYETIINDFPDSDRVALSKAKLTEMGY